MHPKALLSQCAIASETHICVRGGVEKEMCELQQKARKVSTVENWVVKKEVHLGS